MFNRFQVTRKQKDIISGQKELVEHQKSEVDLAHAQLTEKNKEILDSIVYAKRIQQAILPPDKLFKSYLKDSFVLYIPKDVVAGDFYWMETVERPLLGGIQGGATENPKRPHHPAALEIGETHGAANAGDGELILWTAADCTGHGVPGAMVSVVCVNGLNRAVREFGLRDPAEILEKTRELVIREFEKSEEDVKDGMDISLCVLDTKTRKLHWAGAHNPLWIATTRDIPELSQDDEHSSDRHRKMEGDGLAMFEVRADKQPIGKHINRGPFTKRELQLHPGDTLYTFTDGFPDQFGGERGKKFKSGSFKRTLLRLSSEPIEEQGLLLQKAFEAWRGEHEQVDDVCVIGVRI